MKLAVLEATQGNNSTWSNLDHINSQDLANLLASGVFVAASLEKPTGKSSTLKFYQSDTLMVRISLACLPLKVALGADFTQRYATVAAYTEEGKNGGELLLAFELPSTVTNAGVYARLLAGIESVYAGARDHSKAEQAYGLAVGSGTALVLGGKLDLQAVRYLDKLGKEANEIKKGRGAFLRSHITLDQSSVLTLPDGDERILSQLHKEEEVFCPVHVDNAPTGIVHWYADGTPGVQCSYCKRTYAAPTTQRHYDFGFFDRTIKALAADQPSQTMIANGLEFGMSGVASLAEQYLPALPLESGVTFVKSPKGTGKTEALVALVAECKKKHLRVLLLGHRRALLQSISSRLGIDCYFIVEDEPVVTSAPEKVADALLEFGLSDENSPAPEPIGLADDGKEETGYQKVSPTKHFAICLDSMLELEPSSEACQYDVVIIDEAEQVFTHLTGETLKGHRREVFLSLSHYLRVAPYVYLLDADLNMVTMSASFEVFKPEKAARVVVNEPTTKQEQINLYANRGQLAKLLIDRVGAGEKVFVTTNSKRKAIELSKLLLEKYPTTRLAVVTSDNSQRKEVQALLGDITNRFEHVLDVLIASPAIGTGIDITFKDGNGEPRKVVDSVFGFFEANIVTHFDIDQQLMRVRHPGEVHVWVDTTPMNYETDVGCIKRELNKSVRRTNFLLRYEDDGSPVYAEDNGLVNIWAQVLAASRGSKNKLAELFRALRKSGGWNLVDVEYDDGAAQFGKAAMKAARELRLKERMENLLAAEQLARDEAAILEEKDKRGLPLTDKERQALERYQIENFYDQGDITPDLIDFDDEGRTRQSVMRLECLTSKQEWFEIGDAKEAWGKVVAFDRRRHLAQREVLETVFAASGLFDPDTRMFKTDVSVDATTLNPFLQAIESKRRQIEALFGLPIYEDCWRKPVVQLKGILGLVGLDLENTSTEQKNGKKLRRYGIPADMLNEMVRAVTIRDLKYQRDAAERPELHECTKTSSVVSTLM